MRTGHETPARPRQESRSARHGFLARLSKHIVIGVRMRLTLWYVATLALVLLVCSSAIYATEQQALLAQTDSQFAARLHQIAGSYDARSGRLTAVPNAATARGDEVALLLMPAGRVVQTIAMGQLAAVKAPWPQVVRTLSAVARSVRPTVVEQGLLLTVPAGATKDGLSPATTTIAGLFRLSGTPLIVRHRVAALLVVGVRSDVPGQMAALARTLETVVPLVLLLCAAGGYWLATRALRPVQAIARTAQRISATDLSRRLNLRGRDELGQLGTTIDHMLDRLESALERQRQFTADASHELRTPLTIVDLEASRALAQPRTPAEYRRAIAVMQQETAYMTRLVDDLLLLARSDRGQATLHHETVDLEEVVLDVAERLEPLARRDGMQVWLDPLPDVRVRGDRNALSRMLTNIVENALKYGAGHGTYVRIDGGYRQDTAASQGRDSDGGVWLHISDDGPGIAPEHLPHLCERFYRADQARTHATGTARDDDTAEARPGGSGLGLPIAQAIARAHGGHLSVHSEADHGTHVEIWLPTRDEQET